MTLQGYLRLHRVPERQVDASPTRVLLTKGNSGGGLWCPREDPVPPIPVVAGRRL